MKNDTNFSGGYAYAVAAQSPHGPPPGQNPRHPPLLCPIRVQYGAQPSDSKGSRALRTC